MNIRICDIFFRVIIVLVVTLPMVGCAGFRAATPVPGEGESESGYSLRSNADIHRPSRQSSSTPGSKSNSFVVSSGQPGSDPGVFAEQSDEPRPIVAQGETNYENATLTEDITWRGSVLIRGYVVIAPQATVRIEPGTVVRFMKSPVLRQMPRLVVLGRLQCSGTREQPILMIPNVARSAPGDWGGIALLSSEKRNQFDHVRIEGAATGIDARFSTLAISESTITRSMVGVLLRDSVARLAAVHVDDCETGLEAFDSELDVRNSSFDHDQRGISARRTTLVLQGVSVKNSEQMGITADECRIKFDSCDFNGNAGAINLGKTKGRIVGSRFVNNRGVVLALVSSCLKIHKNQFTNTAGDGIRMDDGQSVIWENVFEDNSGYNLVNSGRESISAVRNWWGATHETAISAKLLDAAKTSGDGLILFFPWLAEKPVTAP